MVFRQYYHFLLNPLTGRPYINHECIFVANSLVMDNPELHCAIRNAYTTPRVGSGNFQIFRYTSVCLCRRSSDCHFLKFGCLWVLTVTPRKYWNYSYTVSPDCRRDKFQYNKYSCLIYVLE